MYINDQKSFEGRLSLKSNLEFFFYENHEIVSDFHKAVVYYRNSFANEPEI